jgi:amino acid efflux transporter
MPSQNHQLKKTLGLVPAVGLAINLVVGSGLLILPGLAYQKAGGAAVYAWAVGALVSIPLLVVFARLGADIPGAGGVAGFMQFAFSRRAGAATEILLLGAIPGGAGIAITGGKYFGTFFGGSPAAVICGTLLILSVGGAVNFAGAKTSGKIQKGLSFILVALLILVAAVALAFGDTSAGEGLAPLAQAGEALPTVALVFFAYVGWELMSFMSEEFKNPKRDFPLMVVFSYLIVVVLYLLVALAVQFVLPRDHPQIADAPIAALLTIVAGKLSGRVVAAIGLLIVVVNFIGVVWAFSRLIYASAREGLLPGGWSRLHSDAKIPRNAVMTAVIAFGAVSLFYSADLLSQATLFEIAGVSFFMAYLLSVAAYIRRSRYFPAKVFGLLTLAGVGYVFLRFGLIALYPITLFAFGFWIHTMRHPVIDRMVKDVQSP